MNVWVKRGLTLVVGIVALVFAIGAYGLWKSDQKMRQIVKVPGHAFAASTDVVRGRYLFESRGCAECHGSNGAGRAFIDTPDMRVKTPKIGPGAGSMAVGYTPEDWDRLLRHGVKRDGRPVFVMPSEDYARYTDADVAAVVAYVQSLPDVPGGPLESKVPLPVRVLHGLGQIPFAYERIDHSLPPPQAVAEAVTPEHGRYVANTCMGCHGEHLSGGKIPGGPPDWPAAANLTPGAGGVMDRYPDDAKFIALMRSGKRPDGTPVKVMPFDSFSKMNDVDLAALRLFLTTLPAQAAGSR